MSGAIFFFTFLFILIVPSTVALYMLFEKAGEAGWKSLIPGLNWYIWLKLIGKPTWWLVLYLLPIVGVLVGVAMTIDLVKAFGKHKLIEHAAALILPFYYLPKLAFDPNVKYLGPAAEQKDAPQKSSAREWGDAILFAGVAALIIRSFFIEAFMIPTSSMERTLMAGDFLFVSKFHYGPRLPRVPLSIPFIHNKIKIGDFTMPSYTDIITLPYYRMPGLTKVKRNDIVVFNYPAQDQEMWKLRDGLGTVKVPTMKENYIKRCVAAPGDILEIKQGVLYINGELGYQPPNLQKEFIVIAKPGASFAKAEKGDRIKENGQTIFLKKWSFPRMKELGFRTYISSNKEEDYEGIRRTQNYNWMINDQNRGIYTLFMSDSIAEIIRSMDEIAKVEEVINEKGVMQVDRTRPIYPQKFNGNGKLVKNNVDNFGPMTLPKKGMTVDLTVPLNLSYYWRAITAYEGHELQLKKGGKLLLDGKEVNSYTFEMDYYWMMGDNRHNSEDSRYWGYVPEDHIVGKPLFVFMSFEGEFGMRFSRIGTHNVK
ncbi:MAG: signal peptidase I [Bacteroidia bacterium]|nr:signal peptidase I [Bacteroidia bacterium]